MVSFVVYLCAFRRGAKANTINAWTFERHI
jgi:hypothetical protein